MRKKLLAVVFVALILVTTFMSVFDFGQQDSHPFKVEPSEYAYDALEPYISKEIMTLHHDKHYQTYVDNLNKALASYSEYQGYSLQKLMQNLDSLPKEISTAV